jgi:hypothetical protein
MDTTGNFTRWLGMSTPSPGPLLHLAMRRPRAERNEIQILVMSHLLDDPQFPVPLLKFASQLCRMVPLGFE